MSIKQAAGAVFLVLAVVAVVFRRTVEASILAGIGTILFVA